MSVEKKELPDSLKGMIVALKEIGEIEGTKGTIECPECEGKLHWIRSKINGHVWGKCETKDCLSWMM